MCYKVITKKSCHKSIIGWQTCRMYAKTPAKPVVSMPMAYRFNEKVAMDLKSWKGQYILHMIYIFTRFSVSVFIKEKTSGMIQ